MNAATALENARAWSIEERLELCFGLWDKVVEEGWKPEMTDELKSELARRLSTYEKDPTNVRSWEQIVTRASGSR